MLILTKNLFIKKGVCYFEQPKQLPKNIDILLCLNNFSEMSCSRSCKTYVDNLENYTDSNSIIAAMNSTTRNCINRCVKNNIEIEILTSDIPNKKLGDFIKMHKIMCKEKNIKHKINKNYLKDVNKSGCLIMSIGKYENLNLVYHVYIKSQDAAVLWFSCSSFRNKNSNKKLIGEINRYQHFKDLIYFKENGVKKFDWGGVRSFEDPCGIDIFKYSFPGTKTYVYEKSIPLSKKGALFLKIKNLFK